MFTVQFFENLIDSVIYFVIAKISARHAAVFVYLTDSEGLCAVPETEPMTLYNETISQIQIAWSFTA